MVTVLTAGSGGESGGDLPPRWTCSSAVRADCTAGSTTAVDEVEIVGAELGTWAGAIGARSRVRTGGWRAMSTTYQPRTARSSRRSASGSRPRARRAAAVDADLCTEFAVSRMTARNAMERLAAAG